MDPTFEKSIWPLTSHTNQQINIKNCKKRTIKTQKQVTNAVKKQKNAVFRPYHIYIQLHSQSKD